MIFSILILSLNPVLAQDSTSITLPAEINTTYPGKPLIMSLVIPGSGQYYNKSPLWKTASFLGIEIGSIFAWNHFKEKANLLRTEYQNYADMNWSIGTWVENRFNPPSRIYSEMAWTNFPALIKIHGTHELTLVLSGTLKEQFGEFVSSDSLETHPDWVDSGEISVVTDRHFYENIGKYDQFVGGWSDVQDAWYWEEKQLEDSTEIVIKTPYKEDYLGQRVNSNQALTMVKYSITTLLFNHVLSGFEAVLTSQKQSRKNQRVEEIETDISLLYNPLNTAGIGGISLTINF